MPIGANVQLGKEVRILIPTSLIFMAVSSAMRHASVHSLRFRSALRSDYAAKYRLTPSSAKALQLRTKSSLDMV